MEKKSTRKKLKVPDAKSPLLIREKSYRFVFKYLDRAEKGKKMSKFFSLSARSKNLQMALFYEISLS